MRKACMWRNAAPLARLIGPLCHISYAQSKA